MIGYKHRNGKYTRNTNHFRPALEALEDRVMLDHKGVPHGGGGGGDGGDTGLAYTITDLGTLGGEYSTATGVNDLGHVVGFADLPPNPNRNWRPFYIIPEDADGDGTADTWFRDADGDGANDLMINLGTLSGEGRESRANDVNNLGHVVGGSWKTADELGAFVFHDSNGNRQSDPGEMVDLLKLTPSGETVMAWAVNNRGQVVGTTASGSSFRYFLIDPDDTDADGAPDTWVRDDDGDGVNDLMIDLMPPLTPCFHVCAWNVIDINDAGQILTGIDVIIPEDTDGDGTPDVWARDDDGDGVNDLAVTLPTLGGTEHGAGEISAGGVIVGKTQDADGEYHNVTWQIDAAGNVALADFLGDYGKGKNTSETHLYRINDTGLIGGYAELDCHRQSSDLNVGCDPFTNRAHEPVLWQNGAIVLLEDLAATMIGLDDIDHPTAISNAGHIIGEETNFELSGAGMAWIAVPNISSSNLTAETTGNNLNAESLTASDIAGLVTEAVVRLEAAGADRSRFSDAQFVIADLPGATLGIASGNTIYLDSNAAGWGWFVDPTSWEDSEFTTPGDQGEQNRMDLLTVIAHELGHVLGYEHEADGVMAATLAAGERQIPGFESAAEWEQALYGLGAEEE